MDAQPQSLLLIDDEAGLRRSLNFGMAQHGFRVEALEEGLPALDRVERAYQGGRPFNYVVADINLPDINGLKLLEVLKSKYPNQAVVVISAYGNDTTRDQVATRRGDAYLDKPFMADELAAVLASIPVKQAGPTTHAGPAVTAHTVSAYAAIKLKDGCNYAETFRQLYYMDNVIFCDAVQGDMDVIMLLNASNHAELDEIVNTRIRSIPDVAEVIRYRIVKPAIDEGISQFISE
jgi:CheY-like chemotaxis protein